MSSRVLIFHGTEGYPEENWFPWMKEKLEGRGCRVFVPQFPSPPRLPARVSAWFGVLKNYQNALGGDTVIIGHSLGGVFALRLLEKSEKPIRAVFFVGTPIGKKPILNYERDRAFSGFDFDWLKIKSGAKYFSVYQSDNDPYVSLGNGEQLAKNLGVDLTFVPGAGHFNAQAGYIQFPRLLEAVKKCIIAERV